MWQTEREKHNTAATLKHKTAATLLSLLWEAHNINLLKGALISPVLLQRMVQSIPIISKELRGKVFYLEVLDGDMILSGVTVASITRSDSPGVDFSRVCYSSQIYPRHEQQQPKTGSVKKKHKKNMLTWLRGDFCEVGISDFCETWQGKWVIPSISHPTETEPVRWHLREWKYPMSNTRQRFHVQIPVASITGRFYDSLFIFPVVTYIYIFKKKYFLGQIKAFLMDFFFSCWLRLSPHRAMGWLTIWLWWVRGEKNKNSNWKPARLLLLFWQVVLLLPGCLAAFGGFAWR